MKNRDGEAGDRQQRLVLEEKNRLLLRQFRKKTAEVNIVKGELDRITEKRTADLIREKIKKKKPAKEMFFSEKNMIWILVFGSSCTLEMCQSFCKYHPHFEGKILVILSVKNDESIKDLLSGYDVSYVQAEEKNEWECINAAVELIESEWIMYIGSEFRIKCPFISNIREELLVSGCHFLNLPVQAQNTFRCIRQRICVDTRWEENGEHIVIPDERENILNIPEFTRLFNISAGIFKRQTFVDFGKYKSEYGNLTGVEFSSRIHSHNYAVANFSFPVLESSNEAGIICTEKELEKYNTEIGYLELCHKLPETKLRVAVIADEEGWAYDNIAHQIQKNLNDFDVDIFYSKYFKSPVDLFFILHDYDVTHVLWRGMLQFLDPESTFVEFEKCGITYEEFKKKYIDRSCLTAAVYDHLYLDKESKVITEKILSVVDEYTVSSLKLFDIYTQSYKKKPSVEITDGVDLSQFYPDKLERFSDITSRKIVIGWVGNSIFWGNVSDDLKGVHTILIPAIKELEDEGIEIVPFFADRQERIIPHEKMKEYYSKIDIYICTSKNEGTPNPVLEAMACGVPVISTDVGIVPEVMGDFQKQFILKTRDIFALKEAIKKMIKEPQNLKRCSEENLRQIQNWSWKNKCAQYGDFFRDAYTRKVYRME